MTLDAALLARIQFALTVAFHYLFPPLSIGLGAIMVYTEAKFLKTRDKQYEELTRFLTRIFAVTFAVGVATGIVMEFQFGLNWSTYSRFVGDIFGSALAAEGIFAFFLESGFLAVLVFGWDRVSERMHFFSTIMVSLGSMFSAIWIVVANSWQQTPAGYHIVNGRAEITDFWAVVFSPSSMPRLAHVLIGAFILGSFFVMSISAYYILKRKHEEISKKMFGSALWLGTVASLLALVQGHFQAKNVAVNQPEKLAAFEGLYTTQANAPMNLFGVPDSESKSVKYAIAIPGMLSFLVHDDMSKTVQGLDQTPVADQPPVALSFYSYHIMIALGMFFIALTLLATFLRWRGALFDKRWLMWVFVYSIAGPYISNQLGWAAAEVGRQPWVVYKLLRTNDAISVVVPPGQILASIVLFGLVYAFLFAIWLHVLNDKIQQGPELHEGEHKPGLADAAGSLAAPHGPSMTEAREEVEEENK
jgi:cytochrome bd ubiquinol oxidase subunit I